ncbi:MAG: alpha-L-fucosidase [Terriglobia bacterium]
MSLGKITRRELVVGAASAAAAAALPFEALAQAGDGQAAGAAAQKPDLGSGRANWMQSPAHGWGVMTHYLADWQAREQNLQMTVELWNKLVDGFDVEGMAKRLETVGAGHYQLSIGQNSGYYLSPNSVYDKFVGSTPSKCSRRDLVADFYQPLASRGIKLMVYLPSGAPGEDRVAREALDWLNGPYRNEAFQIKWQQVIAEWSRRWGNKVAGWWFDGCYFPNSMYRTVQPPNFASFAAAARAGNPNSAIAFNPGVIYRLIGQSPDQDYIAGEIDKPELASVHRGQDGVVDGTQIHMLSFLGTTWGRGTPRFTTDQVIAFTRKIRDHGGAVTWDVPVALDGTIAQPFLDQLSALGKAFPKSS